MLFKDRVKETTTTTGTGNITTAGAVTGFITCNTAFGTGSANTFAYVIDSPGGAEWEVGQGYMSAATTLVRSTVLASSNAGAAVNFSAGTKYIRATLPAAGLMQTAVLQADISKTNATFSNATDLTLTLASGRWYDVSLRFKQKTGTIVGGDWDLNGGTATVTAVSGHQVSFGLEGDLVIQATSIAALSTVMSSVLPNEVDVVARVMIHVNAGGTLIPRFKQASTNATANVFAKYSTIEAMDVTP